MIEVEVTTTSRAYISETIIYLKAEKAEYGGLLGCLLGTKRRSQPKPYWASHLLIRAPPI